MAARGKHAFNWHHLAISAGVAAATLTLAPAPASAGFFEQLFGGLRQAFSHRPAPPRHADSFADPFTSLARALSGDEPRPDERVLTRDSGPSRGFCVRTCDGHFFPVAAQAGMSAADACHSFCPASETRLYSGSNIDYATTSDGSRYADLPNAYRYRKQLVAGCTCNGRTAFGLAHVDLANDPTLKPGDVVATKNGLMAVEASRDRTAAFTPVASSNLPKSERAALSQLKVTRDYGVPRNDVTGALPTATDTQSAALAK
jgi:hypothetical protein